MAPLQDAKAKAERRQERSGLIQALREARGTDVVVSYVTSTRPGVSASMTVDAFRYFFEHMPESQVGKLDLFIQATEATRRCPGV